MVEEGAKALAVRQDRLARKVLNSAVVKSYQTQQHRSVLSWVFFIFEVVVDCSHASQKIVNYLPILNSELG